MAPSPGGPKLPRWSNFCGVDIALVIGVAETTLALLILDERRDLIHRGARRILPRVLRDGRRVVPEGAALARVSKRRKAAPASSAVACVGARAEEDWAIAVTGEVRYEDLPIHVADALARVANPTSPSSAQRKVCVVQSPLQCNAEYALGRVAMSTSSSSARLKTGRVRASPLFSAVYAEKDI